VLLAVAYRLAARVVWPDSEVTPLPVVSFLDKIRIVISFHRECYWHETCLLFPSQVSIYNAMQLPNRLNRFRTKQALLTTSMLFTLAQSALQAEGLHPLQGHVPKELGGLVAAGRLDPTQRLDLAIGLPLGNRDLLKTFLTELYDPASPEFGKYLGPEDFTDVFGPTEPDYQAVLAFVKENGFVVTHTHANRMLLDVTGTVADIERAFRITLRTYQHPTEGRTFYSPDTEPVVNISLPILDISGLDNFRSPRPLLHRMLKTPAGVQPQYGSGPGGSYVGHDFRAAYVPNVGATGAGQTVGLLEFDAYYASDITSYETQTGLPNVPLKNVLLDNFNGNPGSGNIEVALDIDMAIAMAPGLSQVIVYEAGPRGIPNDILNRMATDNLAKELSSSWAWSGGPNSTTDQIFQQLAAQGQSFFQASGDDDAYTGSILTPSDNPYITVVGGTTLTTTGPGGAWVSETTWNWYSTGIGTSGSSGGVSPSYTIPTWQQGISMTANQGSTAMRNIPDVALTADNIWVIYNNGSSGGVGGTSCAAPLWAGFAALINQQALANGKALVGFVNPAIYSIAKGTSYASCFHDITTGNNTNTSSPTKFFAVPGLDLCTGWGTPAGGALINALAGSSAPQIAANSFTLIAETCTNNAVDPGETVTVDFGLINVGSASTANLVATLEASGGVTSASSPQTYGVLTAGGAEVTRPFSFMASGTCGGTVTATLQLQDGAENLGTVNFSLKLGTITTTTTAAQSFDSVTAPALPSGWSSSVISGSQVNWVATNGFYDTGPNSAFALDPTNTGLNELVSPVIPITSSSAQLAFRHNYRLVYHTSVHPRSTTYYDGGVLEISIGGGAFTDILAAGGSFVSGGYNCTIATGTGNPLAGRNAWGGTSSGWITTSVNLPPGAAGQNIRLRWGCGAGNFTGSTAVGWFVDTISVQDTQLACCSPGSAVAPSVTAEPTNQVSTLGGSAAFYTSATGSTPLSYQWSFNGTNLVGATGNTLLLTNIQANQAGAYGVVVTNAAGAAVSSSANLKVLVPPSINSIKPTGTQVSVQVSTVLGLSYLLEYKSSITASNWTPVSSWVTGTGGILLLQDTNAVTATRFYRISCQ